MIIEAKHVSKLFGSVAALSEVNISIPNGAKVLFAGPNGSGKTTLLRILAGLTSPTSGTVLIDGQPPRTRAGLIGYVGHDALLYPHLSVEENLTFGARIHGVPEGRVRTLIEQVGLTHRAKSRSGTLSRGERQRAAIARALTGDPDLLIADEPFTGLDDEGAAIIPKVLIRPGRTLLMASHETERSRGLNPTVIPISNGALAVRT